MSLHDVAPTDHLHVHTDGASRGNPGPAAHAHVVSTPDGELLDRGGGFLGEATNNEAEYHAVIQALARLLPEHPGPVIVHSDSQLLVKQVTGEWRLRAENLEPLHREVRELAAQHGDVEFRERRRDDRRIGAADAHCNELLDRHTR